MEHIIDSNFEVFGVELVPNSFHLNVYPIHCLQTSMFASFFSCKANLEFKVTVWVGLSECLHLNVYGNLWQCTEFI